MCPDIDDASQKCSISKPCKGPRLLQKIKAEYPLSVEIKNGNVDKMLRNYTIVEGARAPDFMLTTMEGKEISLSDYKGKYVFIDFWGTWCGPCRSEIPYIVEMRKVIPEDKLAILGVTCRDQEKKVKVFIKENEINYDNAMADDNIISDYGITSYPTTFLIDDKGIIVGKGLRGSNLTSLVKNSLLLD